MSSKLPKEPEIASGLGDDLLKRPVLLCCHTSTAHHVVEHCVPHVHDRVAKVPAVRRLVVETAAPKGPMMRVMSGQRHVEYGQNPYVVTCRPAGCVDVRPHPIPIPAHAPGIALFTLKESDKTKEEAGHGLAHHCCHPTRHDTNSGQPSCPLGCMWHLERLAWGAPELPNRSRLALLPRRDPWDGLVYPIEGSCGS